MVVVRVATENVPFLITVASTTYLGFIKITLRPGFVSLPRERSKQWWRWIESSETEGRGG
ncbi:hypothetical protein ALC57_15654 [Trachymyrmex cornetzi]|uniref:Uncharacterized protein n=1 Tax=Trachymyrmex cornetzi TaxID=471704 RepID=A0A151IWK2_9HYME|nr:hypothetical protein ALC57_15654 [Trachymyrmex cornetzi]